MSMKHLGPSFDIHTGAIDLIFPHHEDELAQSEAATGQPFVQTWLHCAHLQMAGAKMAKSTGNIERVGELLERGVSARALRYVLIAVHYRAALNYTDASLDAAGSALDRLDALLAALAGYRQERPDDASLAELLATARAGFERALDDDLNVAPALAVLFDFVREINRRIDARGLSTADAGIVTSFLHDLDRVLGIGPDLGDEGLTPDQEALLEARSAARTARDWAASDHLRDELAQTGIVVEDTRDGQRWRRLEDLHG
jgi:cysteinyl-tRNA synthetase